jgi:hypothetical protein
MKFQVSLLVPIPPHDQIMLIGPPYKILDSLVRCCLCCQTCTWVNGSNACLRTVLAGPKRRREANIRLQPTHSVRYGKGTAADTIAAL